MRIADFGKTDIAHCESRKLATVRVAIKQRSIKNETNQSVKSERHNFVSILGDNSRMCRGVLEALPDCGAGDIHLHSVDVCRVRRSNGRTERLVE